MLFRKGKLCIRTVFVIVLSALCLNLGVRAAHRTILQQGIAQEILRFHVLANSDSEADQRVKYLVRDEILSWMEEQRKKEAAAEQNYAGKTGRMKVQESAEKTECIKVREDTGNKTYFEKRENAESYLLEHLSELEAAADRVLRENGMDYHAKAALEQVYFSERVYGEYTFPAGWYEALRVRLGKADGHNWWCVLYPDLGFSDCIRGVTKEGDSAGDLKEVLTAQEYESLFCEPKKWKITFRWF